jgi:hypothetical protein
VPFSVLEPYVYQISPLFIRWKPLTPFTCYVTTGIPEVKALKGGAWKCMQWKKNMELWTRPLFCKMKNYMAPTQNLCLGFNLKWEVQTKSCHKI